MEFFIYVAAGYAVLGYSRGTSTCMPGRKPTSASGLLVVIIPHLWYNYHKNSPILCIQHYSQGGMIMGLAV